MKFPINKSIWLLAAILISIILVVISVTGFLLYHTAFNEERERLLETVQSQARLIESVAEFDRKYSHSDVPGGAEAATLSQIRKAHENYQGVDETGEFTLAKLENNTVHFLLRHRNKPLFYDPAPPNEILIGSNYAEPMQLALSGQSGSIVAHDYRGAMVLAAYEPVAVLNYGIVAKIDIQEIREPFIVVSLISFAIGGLLIILGIYGFSSVTHPLFQRIARNEKEMRQLLNSTGEGIYGIDLEGNCTFVNQSCLKILGYESVDELIGNNMHDLIHHHFKDGSDYPIEQCQIIKAIHESRGTTIDHEVLWRKDGTSFPAEYSSFPVIENKKTIGAVVSFNDITDKKEAEQKLQLAANVFNNTREGIMITDKDVHIVEVNDSFKRITGYQREDVIGKNPSILQSGKQGNEFYAALWQELLDKGHWTGEIWNQRKDGSFFAELLTISTICDVQGHTQNYIGLFSDITSQKKHQQQLEYIAHHDSLTSLPNRVLLIDRLKQNMLQTKRRKLKLAVAYLDLDGFKEINDTYGHDVGDQLLLTLASLMKQILRESDTIARLGGDEFVALMPDLAATADSLPFLNRLLEVTSQPIQINDVLLQISASVGVTYYPQTEESDADTLLRQADQAMYQAKLTGKNHYHVFDSEQDRNLRGRHASLKRIREALNKNEFELYFQPKVNMHTGCMVSAEALIRWNHPEQGVLSPFYFLPVIENDPLSLDIDKWVIETALAQMKTWKAAEINIPLSINIGAHFLQQPDTIEYIKNLLTVYSTVNSGDLMFEILESTALDDMDRVIKIMHGCSELGVSFALDDFGTGYSSLTYLKRLPATQLKVDQSFVRNMLDDPDDLRILEGILNMARAFQLQVVVEGVEEEAHVELLLRFGCEFIQGYAIARPMPAADLVKWSKTWQPDQKWMNRHTINRADFPLLFAGIDHRAWIQHLEEYLHGERTAPPPMNHHQCRFGQWLYEEGTVRFRTETEFQAIIPLHRQVHVLAQELCNQKLSGQDLNVTGKLNELYTLRNNLLKSISELLKKAEDNALQCDISEY
ncbi:MAG: EAL domain-containing protein [gamma proteobacterium symbiont of Taylorina sp.]|nr:EAL domain-containing protein [gamma proteobacterium symbiont of Taylorina sp.]